MKKEINRRHGPGPRLKPSNAGKEEHRFEPRGPEHSSVTHDSLDSTRPRQNS